MANAPMGRCRNPACAARRAGLRCRDRRHQDSRNHGGVPRQARGHGADYQAARASLIGKPCHWCGEPATTADYRIPVSRGGTLADLVPACSHCNFARGNRMAPR